jgi:hypothetical protein
MYGVFLNETDGYTYSCKSLVGVYTSRDLAETAVLEHAEAVTKEINLREAKRDIWEDLRSGEITREECVAKLNELPEDNQQIILDDIDNYSIEELPINQPINYV